MAEADIPARNRSSKNFRIISSPFEVWASANGYDIVLAVAQSDLRTYADRDTQAAYEAWSAGVAYVVRIVTESDWETEVLRDKLKALACAK
jgi:hypothetical protein